MRLKVYHLQENLENVEGEADNSISSPQKNFSS